MNSFIDENLDRILPELKGIEEYRKKIVRKILKIRAIFTPLIILILYFLFLISSEAPNTISNIMYWIMFILIGVQEWLVSNSSGSFRKDIKEAAMPIVVKALDDSFEYSFSTGNFSISDITSMFYRGDRVYPEDFVKGRINNVDVQFCEETIRLHGFTGSRRNDVKIFSGQCYTLTFNKPISSPVFISTNTHHSSPELLEMRKIKTGYNVFDRMFEVYCNNESVARYILSPDFMLRLGRLKSLKYAKDVHVLFVDDKIHIAIASSKDMFEFSVYKSVLNKNVYAKMLSDFCIINEIIEVLNLTERS